MNAYKITVTNAVTGEVVGIGYTGTETVSSKGNPMFRLTFKVMDGLKKFQITGFMTLCKPK